MGAYNTLFGHKPEPAIAAQTLSPTAPPPEPQGLAAAAGPPDIAEPAPSPALPEVVPEIATVPPPADVLFRTPLDLMITATPVRRALIIGACFSEIFPLYLGFAFPGGIAVDHILYGQGTLPEVPPQPLDAYDFQVIMPALRVVIPEQIYFRLAYNDIAGHEAAFAECRERLLQVLHGALVYRAERPLTTFVANFTLPQQNSMGRLLPRYDLRNPVYFIESLNRVMVEEIAGMHGVHLLDIDQISANFGRKYFQDDVVSLTTHQSVTSTYESSFDSHRLEPPKLINEHHILRVEEYVLAVCHEIQALHRTVSQSDQVKLVIVDLDDTLWRGVVAEEGLGNPMLTEGWPIAFVEALAYLKKRGVLLAIASKNDETRIRELWPHIYGSRLELSDFASVKINWQPKSENIAAILKEMNLLSRSVVFIDDNPVERAAVLNAFPDIRVLGSEPYQFRRVLLWAPETQVAYITDESSRRTEMIQAQVERETTQGRLTRAEFLDTLGVRMRLFPVGTLNDQRFARALELINKSNQFNTTGRRWTQDECAAAFAAGTQFWAFEVEDRFTHYGIVGVAIKTGNRLDQFVMSCRVVGLEVEIAAIGAIVATASAPATAAYVATDANHLCRDLYARCGFIEMDGGWIQPDGAGIPRPAHINELTVSATG